MKEERGKSGGEGKKGGGGREKGSGKASVATCISGKHKTPATLPSM